ncbi:MAG: hypothetical protein ABUR63_05490, partial [Verrucomicrobiota bacterium]
TRRATSSNNRDWSNARVVAVLREPSRARATRIAEVRKIQSAGRANQVGKEGIGDSRATVNSGDPGPRK